MSTKERLKMEYKFRLGKEKKVVFIDASSSDHAWGLVNLMYGEYDSISMSTDVFKSTKKFGNKDKHVSIKGKKNG